MPDPPETAARGAATTTQRINPPAGYPRILPHLIYKDVGAAVKMLTDRR